VVGQLVELLGNSPETIPTLLEFLTVLPEEVNNNNRIPIGVSCDTILRCVTFNDV
jgi:transportin-3